jgi:hypothetical protein
MDSSIAPSPVRKRGRNSSVILTDRLCEKRVAKRAKLYDRKCPGLYVSITAAGVATFSYKFTDRQTGKQRTGWLGVYNAETFTVEDARSRVYGLKGLGTEALAETFRDQKTAKARRGKTVAEIIEERIEWMKTPVKKPDGEMRPRLESWENTASHLQRFIRPRLGKKLAMEVTKHDIATLSNDIVAGKFGKPSVSNARHMRKAASGLFNWAAEAGRDYVNASPCINLPKLDPEHPRTRVLTEGLPNLPATMSFESVAMSCLVTSIANFLPRRGRMKRWRWLAVFSQLSSRGRISPSGLRTGVFIQSIRSSMISATVLPRLAFAAFWSRKEAARASVPSPLRP